MSKGKRIEPSRSNHIDDLTGPLLIEEFEVKGIEYEAWRVPIPLLEQWLEMRGLENPQPLKGPFAKRFWPGVGYTRRREDAETTGEDDG